MRCRLHEPGWGSRWAPYIDLVRCPDDNLPSPSTSSVEGCFEAEGRRQAQRLHLSIAQDPVENESEDVVARPNSLVLLWASTR